MKDKNTRMSITTEPPNRASALPPLGQGAHTRRLGVIALVATFGGLLFGITCGLYYRKQAKRPASIFTSDREELLRKTRHSSFSSLSSEERRRLMKNLPKDKN